MPSSGTANLATEAWAFCHSILPDVSRTFALNIPVLPPRLRDSVCCAYLLCRIADTVEDTESLSETVRSRLYDQLDRAVDPHRPAGSFDSLGAQWSGSGNDAYARLVDGTALVLSAYASLPEADRVAIAACVREMIAGMRVRSRRAADGLVRIVCED